MATESRPLGHLTAMDGGNAGNAGAVSGDPRFSDQSLTVVAAL